MGTRIINQTEATGISNDDYILLASESLGYRKFKASKLKTPELSSKSITANGTYNASDDNVDGYSQVTVNVSGAKVVSGTFVTANTQYGVTTITCGFKPDFVFVFLPINDVDTTSYWWNGASWGASYAQWNLLPAEYGQYQVPLNRANGETGIRSITNNGFTFLVNASNTQGVTCKYIAGKLTA